MKIKEAEDEMSSYNQVGADEESARAEYKMLEYQYRVCPVGICQNSLK